MAITAIGLIFADSFGDKIKELVRRRTMAAIPFGSRYRVIDFALSNMSNADIRGVGIITREKYHSLIEHVRGGAEWDLDRKNSGLYILPPFSTDDRDGISENRLEALMANRTILKDSLDEYVVLTSSNYVANIDIRKALKSHVESGARVTVFYTNKAVNRSPELPFTTLKLDGDKVTGIAKVYSTNEDEENISLNSYIFKRTDLLDQLRRADLERLTSLRFDIIGDMIGRGEVHGFEVQDRVLFMDDLKSYLMSNLALLEPEIRNEIFNSENRPILTKTHDSSPTSYGPDAKTSNSLIADGAKIEGEVRNSIIFRGVHVKPGAVVENSVVMQNSVIGRNARISYSVLDKRVTINDDRQLSGYITHPFFVETNGVI